MYATTRRYEGVKDPAQAAKVVQEGFVPIISKVPGFVAYYFVDAGNGVMASTGIFETQEGAEESTRRAAEFVKEHLAPLLPNAPVVAAGQVLASG